MKIIDLLDIIARGEEPPKKILYKYVDEEYIFEYDEYNFDYQNEWGVWLFEDICFDGENHLNEEVKLLETAITYKPDKIEKMGISYMKEVVENGWANEYFSESERKIINKINEIIDHINKEV